MRIALDCRTVTAPKTGDRTYALNLLRALAQVDTENEYLYYTWEPTTLTEVGSSRVQPILLPASPRWTWTPIAFPRDLGRRQADLAHVQYLIPPVAPCPVITTIHDVAFRKFPTLFPLKHRLLLNALIPLAAHNSAAIITGSESTRQDLIELFGVTPEKVVVTPYAADPIYQPMDQEAARRAVRSRLRVPSPYLLSVGVLQPRKNLPRLVRAYNRIASRIPHRLVLVGKEGWAGEALQEAIAEAPPGREPIFTGYVADADLPALYSGADLFVYPSLYEGFGLPPLEAMARGTAVISSNTSSLPEVVDNAGLTLDPTDTEALSTAMETLLQDEPRRRELEAAGLARAAQFNWERTARETVEVYRQVKSLIA
ncbi:MAG: glycosyltransferase family 4 protein [Actinomycetota bacterium]